MHHIKEYNFKTRLTSYLGLCGGFAPGRPLMNWWLLSFRVFSFTFLGLSCIFPALSGTSSTVYSRKHSARYKLYLLLTAHITRNHKIFYILNSMDCWWLYCSTCVLLSLLNNYWLIFLFAFFLTIVAHQILLQGLPHFIFLYSSIY